MGVVLEATKQAAKQAGKKMAQKKAQNSAAKAAAAKTAQNVGANAANAAKNYNKNMPRNNGMNAQNDINKGFNRNNGFDPDKRLNNQEKLHKENQNFREKMANRSLSERPNPLGLGNYKERLNQVRQKRKERGQEPESASVYIEALPLTTKVIIGSFIGLLCLIFFVVILIVSMNDENSRNTKMMFGFLSGGVISSNYSNLKNVSIHNTTSSGESSIVKKNLFGDKITNMFNNIGRIFTTNRFEKSEESPETQYYQKGVDIARRYKEVYGVEFSEEDLDLIYVTNIKVTNSDTMFEENLNNYTVEELDDTKNVMSLDWEYDYENLPDYDYLSRYDYRYDLQILFKNMVKKTTTQTCMSGATVLQKKVVYDTLDTEFVEGNENYLVCKAGTYKIENKYEIDRDKYDDFLLEYLYNRHYGTTSDKGRTREGTNRGSSTSTSNSTTSTVLASLMGGILGWQTMAPINGDWGWPLPEGATRCRSSVYGTRIHPITGVEHFHSGDDYPAAGGTPVYAIGDGTVIETKTTCVVGDMNCAGGAGNYVKIDHGNGIVSVYMHSSNVQVIPGQKVSRGQQIMLVGTTGSSTGNHLHITLRLNGALASPSEYIGALAPCS